MKRNFFRFILSAALMMCCNTVWALYGSRGGSYEGTCTVKDCTYYLYNGYSYYYEGTTRSVSGRGAVLVSFNSSSASVVSSVTYGGNSYPVVAIGEQSYDDKNSLPSTVTIPNTVEIFEAFAFDEGRDNLVNIKMEDGDKDLFCYRSTGGSYHNGTFSWNTALKTAYIGRNLHYQDEDKNGDGYDSYPPFANLECKGLEVTIGPKVTAIPDYCFYYPPTSSSIVKLNTSNATSLRTIGKYAFYHNRQLQKVSLPYVTEIKNNAFDACDALTEVYLFSDKISIGAYCFRRGEDYTETRPTIYTKNNKVSISKGTNANADDVRVIPENQMLKYHTTDGKAVPIIEGCVYGSYETGEGIMYFDHTPITIGIAAFQNNNSLRTVIIPGTVNYIEKAAFYHCESLTEVFYLGSKDPTFAPDPKKEYPLPFNGSPATIYVADTQGFSPQWMPTDWTHHNVKSWRSGKGNGTAESPYEIENYVNLFGFSLDVQQGNTGICGKLTADITANTGVLNADGTLRTTACRPWTPIGSWGSAPNTYNGFAGEFNGNGHTISGLYFNNETRSAVGLFGMTDKNGYIHDVGVKDSYFRGYGHVAGICGDLAYGRIENCWNGATVIGTIDCAGGIAGSCWTVAYVANCHNVGKVTVESVNKNQCGGICGSVAKNNDANIYSISNCFSLEDKCSVAYNIKEGAQVTNVDIKNTSAFASGEVCWLLNGKKSDTTWRQHLGHEDYPTLSGEHFVNYKSGNYVNYDENITGSGTKDDPYRIGNEFELSLFAQKVNDGETSACAILTADITMNTGVLDSNGNLNGDGSAYSVWTPIGTSEKAFTGTFNGKGHTISGLYCKKTKSGNVGLFGMVTGNAYIHDLGIKDSYFYGTYYVGGICGDLTNAKIEHCWNAATVESKQICGGIAGHCYYASIYYCYNIGKVAGDSYCGGICGKVDANQPTIISVGNCVSLEGKCSKAYNLDSKQQDGTVYNISIQNEDAFKSGAVCWLLNGKTRGTKWRQQLSEDSYPVFTGNYLVYQDKTTSSYHNETMCEVALGHLHDLTKSEMEICGSGERLAYVYCKKCGKSFEATDRTKEINVNSHNFIHVEACIPTVMTTGLYEHFHCFKCGKNSFDGKFATEEDVNIPVAKDNEIWYTTTDKKAVTTGCNSAKSHEYNYGLGHIEFNDKVTNLENAAFSGCSTLQSVTLPSSVTSIGANAFNGCNTLQSVTIPSLVEIIEEQAFYSCSNMQTVTFKSFPAFGNNVFEACTNTSSKILDLTDSEKPYIGTSTDNYPGFTEARYHRTLEKEWGTIVLPFAPTGGMEGMSFYELKEMTFGGESGSLTFTKVDAPQAGTPYLFRNTSSSFTLTNSNNPTVTVSTTGQTADDFTMKGSFRLVQFDGAANGNLYYLKEGKFWHATGKINIAPFRAYIEGSGKSNVKSFMLVVDDGETTAIPGIMAADGTLDETEAIYDLSGRMLAAPVKGQVNIIRTKNGKTIKRLF